MAQAAFTLERVDLHTSVTFVSLAASGATIDKGILGSHKGINDELLLSLWLAVRRRHADGRFAESVSTHPGVRGYIRFRPVACLSRCRVALTHTECDGTAGGALLLRTTPSATFFEGRLGGHWKTGHHERAAETSEFYVVSLSVRKSSAGGNGKFGCQRRHHIARRGPREKPAP